MKSKPEKGEDPAFPNEEYKIVFYQRSRDGGATFSKPVRIGTQENIERFEMFSGCGEIATVCNDYNTGNWIYVSSDGGATWREKQLPPGADINQPDVVIRDDTIHMVYADYINTAVFYTYSQDLGDTWSTRVSVSQGAGKYSQLAKLAIDDTALHAVWEDTREGDYNVMYSRSTDNGATWSADTRLNDTYYGARARILSDEEGLHVVWCQYHGPGWPGSWSSSDYGIVWYKFSGDSGLTWSDEFRVSRNENIPLPELPDKGANYVRFGEYRLGFCTMWQDKRDGNFDLYFRNSLFHPVTVSVAGPAQVKRGTNLDFTATIENVVTVPVPMTEVCLDISGPLSVNFPLWSASGCSILPGQVLGASPSLPIGLGVPLGLYDLDVIPYSCWVELDRDGFQVEVVD